MIRLVLGLVLSVTALPAAADGFAPVTDKAVFTDLVDGRDLRIGLYDLTINVLPDGSIAGRALGRDITGSWAWKDGFFCRDLRWGTRDIPYNCQLVEDLEGRILRFTTDQGRGQSADFRLR